MALRVAGEEGRAGGEPGRDRRAGRLADRDHSLLAALAAHHQHAVVAQHGGERQPDQLRYPEAGAIEQLDERAQALAVLPRAGRGDQAGDLVLGEELGQRATLPRAVDDRRRIVAAPALGGEEAVELAQRREPSCRRARRHAGLREMGEVAADRRAVGGRQAAAAPPQEGGEVAEVAGIGLAGVGGGVALGRQHLQEGVEIAGRFRVERAGH